MSNRIRLRAPDRMDSRIRRDVETSQVLGIAPHRLRESTTAVLDAPGTASAESTATAVSIVEASAGNLSSIGGNRYRARLIEGNRWGSSGWYSEAMLTRDGPAAWPSGTLMYIDHPTLTEEAERPERSVRDIAARVDSTPVYESDGLYADVVVFPHTQALVESLASAIGLSIRANGTAAPGTVDGRSGMIIESLTPGIANSVDFVTMAGAGGKLVSLVEAARDIKATEAANIEAWFESRIHSDFTQLADDMYGHGRLTREERITLSNAVGDALTAFTAKLQAEAPQLATRGIYEEPGSADAASTATTESTRLYEASNNDIQGALDTAVRTAYGDDGDVTQWIYVCDFDADANTVWYAISDNQSRTTWQQSYSLTTGDAATVATLGDDRIQVVPRTEYVPVPPSDAAPADTDGDADTDADVTESATSNPPAATVPPTSVTDGAPPTVSTQPIEEAIVADSTTGTTPDAAGTTDTAVPAAVTEAQTARAVAETALAEEKRGRAESDAKLARFTALEAARPIAATLLAESSVNTPAAQAQVIATVTATLPMTDANVLDEAKFREAAASAITAKEAEIAEALEQAGVGRVAGFGATTPSTASDATVVASLAESYIAGGMPPEAAKLAAAGRP